MQSEGHRQTQLDGVLSEGGARYSSAAFEEDLVEDSKIDLLETALRASIKPVPASLTYIRYYAQELKLKKDHELGSEYTWSTSVHQLRHLKAFPARVPHSGCFNWIGNENNGLPAYLWDSEAFETVPLTPENFRAGYIAVSWTWGRYQLKRNGRGLSRMTSGTKWKVPKLPLVGPKNLDLLTELKWTLRDIPNARYFWVDLLCIDQEDAQKKATEISKQATIFGRAKGVINYLWTLDNNTLYRAISGFGDLLSWCVRFGPVEEELRRSIIVPQTSPADKNPKEWSAHRFFQLLRGDNWFTSLWALQEIVLFPAGLWVTVDRHYCSVNGESLTTKYFAMAVRLLSLMQMRREQQWKEAEKHYMARHTLNYEQFQALKTEFQSDEHRRKKAFERTLRDHLQKGETPGEIVVETEKRSNRRAPWIIERHHGERPYREEIKQWCDWAFGTAAIDISISASRAAILLAGRNRSVVAGQSREPALLAALKVQAHADFFPNTTQGGGIPHFSADLLNIILAQEGVKMFDVAHASPRPTVIHSITNEEDLSEWEPMDDMINYLHIEDRGVRFQTNSQTEVAIWTHVTQNAEEQVESVEYLRNGQRLYSQVLRSGDLFLTSMSPCMADRLNPQTSHFARATEAIEWVNSTSWHMHGEGRLHIPPTARVQKLVKKPKTSRDTHLLLQPNGSCFEYHIERLSDVKLIWRTQHKALEKLGRPQLLLVPLSIRYRRQAVQSPAESAFIIDKPEVFGIALAGKETLRKDVSMTVWYKFGLYRGWGETEPLGWKDGIIVTSARDERTMQVQKPSACGDYQERANRIVKSIVEQPFDVGDFDIVKYSEIPDFGFVKVGPKKDGKEAAS